MRQRMQHIVFLASFLFSLTLAITTFTNSSFIEAGIGTKGVGILYIVSSIISIFFLSKGTRLLAKLGNRKYFLLIATVHMLSLLSLVLPLHTIAHAIGLSLYLISGYGLIFSFDIFFEHTALIRGRGKTRGLYLALCSIGWVIGPLASAKIISYLGFVGIYALALTLFSLLVVLLEFGLKEYRDPAYTSHRSHIMLHHLWRVPTLHAVVFANFILQFFYAWMVVYMPIYLNQHLGIPWSKIGIIFSIMLTAFVMLDYPLGRLADKIGSEKELTAIGFVIMALTVFGFAFLPVLTIPLIGVLLFFSRVGAATVETMTEIHFFKIIDGENPMFLSIFRDIRPVAYILTPIIATISLALLPFKTSFAVLGFVLLIGFCVALTMEKKRAWWQRSHNN